LPACLCLIPVILPVGCAASLRPTSLAIVSHAPAMLQAPVSDQQARILLDFPQSNGPWDMVKWAPPGHNIAEKRVWPAEILTSASRL